MSSSYNLPKVKRFSEYTNTNILLRKYLVISLIIIALTIILYAIYNKFRDSTNITEMFGNRGKCKKLYKSGLEGSETPDDCIEEDFTNIPKSEVIAKSAANLELNDEELSLIAKMLPSIANSNKLEEYFNGIKVYADTSYRPYTRIKFDPQLDIQYIIITVLTSIVNKLAVSMSSSQSNTNSNIQMADIAPYCKISFVANGNKPTSVNKNYQSVDGMLIHSLEYHAIPDENIVKVMLNFADIVDVELYHWVFHK